MSIALALALYGCSSSSSDIGLTSTQRAAGSASEISQSTSSEAAPPSTQPADSTESREAAETTEVIESAAEAARAAAEANAGRQFGGEEFGLSERQLSERSEAVEGAIGECMAEAGFEYVPVDFATIARAMSTDKSAPGLSRREFVEQYGFGISTQFEKPIVELSLGEQNQRIVDSLGDADRVAYLRTLFGNLEDATYAFALETENFSRTGGCTRIAVAQFFSEAEMLASYFNPGDALIETDERAIQAISDWYDCMVDGGLDGYLHPNDVEFSFQRRLDRIADGRDPADLTGADQAALIDLQEEERAVAAVFTSCEDSVLDPIMNRVESDYYGR